MSSNKELDLIVQNKAKAELNDIDGKSPIYRVLRVIYWLISLIVIILFFIILFSTWNSMDISTLFIIVIVFLVSLIVITGIYLALVYIFFGKRVAILNLGLFLLNIGKIVSWPKKNK